MQGECLICGRFDVLEKHHIFKGPNRNNSDEDGLFVYLCPSCHRGEKGVHGRDGAKMDLYLKQYGQKLYEDNHSREDFIKRYGRNYL